MGPRASALMVLLVLVTVPVVIILGLETWAYKSDAETTARRELPPEMSRAGEVAFNHNTLRLWTFEFEGKRCLWATAQVGRGGRGGLTCWEEKP